MSLLIRPFDPPDAAAVARLFHDTVRTVNLGDYSPEQVDAWAGELTADSAAHWVRRLASLTTYVAVDGDPIVGFSNPRDDGYVDHLFVHHLHQRQGIAQALHQAVEAEARRRSLARVFTHASITARPFFVRMGYQQVTEQTVPLRGVELTNFVMEKLLR
jgi:GNAT superfamily N-acetyltransferase